MTYIPSHPLPDDAPRTAIVTGTAGRDAGKSFRVNEVLPTEMLGFVLRLLAALRLGQQEDLMALLSPAAEDGPDTLAVVLRTLTGCDPEAVRTLVNDALRHVEAAPDPKHPNAYRPLMADDIREMSTLGDVLGAFVRVNLLPG